MLNAELFWQRADSLLKKRKWKDICEKLLIKYDTFKQSRHDKKIPNIEVTYKLSSYFECTIEYLLTGEQPDNELTAKEKNIIQLYRQADLTTQLLVEQAMRNSAEVRGGGINP